MKSRPCFVNYVQTKVVKRLEKFRVKNAEPENPRILLLPLSLGVSSIALLQILDFQLQSQYKRTGRTGFKLHVLHVALSEDVDQSLRSKRYHDLKTRYPDHDYSSIALFAQPELSFNGATANGKCDKSATQIKASSNNGITSYAELLSSLPSATSRTDVLSILRTRRVVEFARQNECESILWGDSTTRLAEKVLSETAKGRGFSLPWQIADGDSPFGLPFYYPMRDLLKKELIPFATMSSPAFDSLIISDAPSNAAIPAASRDSSIDLLMKQYFESVEEQYPSIVANVVRTTGKLEIRGSESSRQCALCRMLLAAQPRTQNGHVNHLSINGGSGLELCYGCATAVPSESRHLIPPI